MGVVTINICEVTRRTLFCECGSRCKPVSREAVDSIVALKDMFGKDMPQFLNALDMCDECQYTHFYRQHWHLPLKVLMPQPNSEEKNFEDKPHPEPVPDEEQDQVDNEHPYIP